MVKTQQINMLLKPLAFTSAKDQTKTPLSSLPLKLTFYTFAIHMFALAHKTLNPQHERDTPYPTPHLCLRVYNISHPET